MSTLKQQAELLNDQEKYWQTFVVAITLGPAIVAFLNPGFVGILGILTALALAIFGSIMLFDLFLTIINSLFSSIKKR